MKLATELAKRQTGHTIYLLDEPTTGLHFDDVRRLLTVLSRLVDQGNTVLVIEHNLDVIKTADWIIDLGPEGGSGGGTLVAEGSPEHIATLEGSHTGRFLRNLLLTADEQEAVLIDAEPESTSPDARRRRARRSLHRRTLNVLRLAQVPGQAAVAGRRSRSSRCWQGPARQRPPRRTRERRVHARRGHHRRSRWRRSMRRHGRRPGLVAALLVGCAGFGGGRRGWAGARGSRCSCSAWLLFGAGQSATLQSRYVGADLADDDQRAKSIAAIVWVGTLGAVFGPIFTPFEKRFRHAASVSTSSSGRTCSAPPCSW